MHDRSLVAFLNGFADTSLPLPRGWEQKTDQYGQVSFNLFFIHPAIVNLITCFCEHLRVHFNTLWRIGNKNNSLPLDIAIVR